MITYIKMKHLEWKLKLTFYSHLLTLKSYIDTEGKDIIELAQRLYTSLKDVPLDELQLMVSKELATIIHNLNSHE